MVTIISKFTDNGVHYNANLFKEEKTDCAQTRWVVTNGDELKTQDTVFTWNEKTEMFEFGVDMARPTFSHRLAQSIYDACKEQGILVS